MNAAEPIPLPAGAKSARAWRPFPSVLLLIVFAACSSYPVLLFSSGHYVNQFMMLAAIPLALIAGPVLLIGVFLSIRKRLLYPPLLCLLPFCWWFSWSYYARPDGIWVEQHAAHAYSSLFVPAGAEHVSMQRPGFRDQAFFAVTYVSKLTVDQLTAFYSNKVHEAEFTLLQVKDDLFDPDAPHRVIVYRNRTGQTCCAWIYDHTKDGRSDDYRRVRVDCRFGGALLNPQSFTYMTEPSFYAALSL